MIVWVAVVRAFVPASTARVVTAARVEPGEEAIATQVDVVHSGLHEDGPIAGCARRACLPADEIDVLVLQFDLLFAVGRMQSRRRRPR